MTITRIHANRIGQVQRFWQRSRYLYQNIAPEDLATLLEHQIAVVGEDRGRIWGFLCLQAEERPPTLPATAPNRAYIRAVALAAGYNPVRAVGQLFSTAATYLSDYALAHQVTIYGDQAWLNRALFELGFTVVEEVQFLALARLQRWQPPALETGQELKAIAFQLRSGSPDDLETLAALDASTFTPLWHFGRTGLQDLLFLGRLAVAADHGAVVGYSAISVRDNSAHLSRLAVHPARQGEGIGRALLVDALSYAKAAGARSVMLNTQVNNTRAERLYRMHGFRPTRQIVPVLELLVGMELSQ